MFRFFETFFNELSNIMTANSRRIIVTILAVATISTTVTMESINIYFIAHLYLLVFHYIYLKYINL